MGMVITPVIVNENPDPDSDEEVAAFLAKAIIPLMGAGYRKQAIVDGMLLAASVVMQEFFISPKLPHRTDADAAAAARQLAKRLNHTADEEYQTATKFHQN